MGPPRATSRGVGQSPTLVRFTGSPVHRFAGSQFGGSQFGGSQFGGSWFAGSPGGGYVIV